MQTVQQRISASVRTDEGGCWRWLRQLDRDGYGRMKVDGRPCAAHRVSFEAFLRPIPDGMQIDHLCRVRDCVNPFHLEPVTSTENTRRGLRIAGSTCKRGHERTDENVRVDAKSGSRICRPCHALRGHEYRARKISA